MYVQLKTLTLDTAKDFHIETLWRCDCVSYEYIGTYSTAAELFSDLECYGFTKRATIDLSHFQTRYKPHLDIIKYKDTYTVYYKTKRGFTND